ncbi:hypothetical protein [Paenibacillus sp. Y412MC10]|nr:hypothetical protein [Paenibacillus sp. Y412MC10]
MVPLVFVSDKLGATTKWDGIKTNHDIA